MFNFGYITKGDVKEHNPNWLRICDHPYRILIVGGSGSGKRNALPNLINHELDMDKIYLCAKDPNEAKYQLLIKFNPNKEQKILTVFDDIIADMLSNRKLNLIVTELFISG